MRNELNLREIPPTFNPEHSELETTPGKAERYAWLLEKAIGHDAKVEAILEIGSYAKGEAVPSSDSDTRIYVSSPDAIIWQSSGSRLSAAQKDQQEQQFRDFNAQQEIKKPRLFMDWYEFNDPVANDIGKNLGSNVEFGLADENFANFEIENLETIPSNEHSLILRSNTLYDPNGYILKKRQMMAGKIYPVMVDFYRKRCLESLPEEIYEHFQPHKMDDFKIKKGRQIQWVKWAVSSLRDAVASKIYIQTGQVIYKKSDVLEYYSSNLPDEMETVSELYEWKTNPEKRERMVEDFLRDPTPYFKKFKDYTEKLEQIISKVNKL